MSTTPSLHRTAALALLVACSPADGGVERAATSGPDPGAATTLDEALGRIDAQTLRRHVSVLAHDSMRGRDTDDIGFERARDYVVEEFARLGLEPVVGDTYLQPVQLLEVVRDAGSRLRVGEEWWTYPEVLVTPDWTGTTPRLEGEGVYVGHDLLTSELADDSRLLDKVVFALAGAPEGRAEDATVARRERAHVELALRAGARAVVFLHPDVAPEAWTTRSDPRRPRRVLADGSAPYPQEAVRVGPTASRRLIEGWGDVGVGVVVEPRHELRTLTSWNVVGLRRGSDPARSDEAVVFTAHLDHVGIGAPDAAGDSIFNGTHDNALGVAKVLGVADALAGTSLPRSVLFLLTGAEESGLLGAWHYVKDPLLPLEKTVAAINHDGGLVDVRTDDVFAWGPEFSTIEPDVAAAAEETGLLLSHAQRPPFGPAAGLLYRSDHYPFLISGVPVVYLMPGFTIEGDSSRGREAWEAYLGGIHHAQADDFDETASYEGPVALTALSLRLTWRLAHMEGMPRTHPDAPVRKSRGSPSGFFFADPASAN